MTPARLLALTLLFAAAPAVAETPVLVELFTSQGCSSCPPADEILADLAKRPDVVALAFHVDYWDDIGWKDKLATPQFTARQKDYARALGNAEIYTPQMVIDGRVDFPGNNPKQVAAALARAGAAKDERPKITLTRTADGVSVVIDGPAGARGAVWYASAAPPQLADVTRGENRGRKLLSVNAVRTFRNAGTYGGGHWQQVLPLPPAGDLAAVWIQPPALGPVLASAVLKAN